MVSPKPYSIKAGELVHDLLTELEARLQPFMLPDGPMPARPREEDSPVPLINIINQRTNSALNARDRIEQILRRLAA